MATLVVKTYTRVSHSWYILGFSDWPTENWPTGPQTDQLLALNKTRVRCPYRHAKPENKTIRTKTLFCFLQPAQQHNTAQLWSISYARKFIALLDNAVFRDQNAKSVKECYVIVVYAL